MNNQTPDMLQAQLQHLIDFPEESLEVEHKSWLDLRVEEAKAKLAKEAIAMANHGGGFIVLGFGEDQGRLASEPCPDGLPEITQDTVNSVIQRYADPEFHCRVHYITRADTGVVHPIIQVPSDVKEPVISKRDCGDEIAKDRCYIRKSGSKSEMPRGKEWRSLLDRCVRASREDMLDSIRDIVLGRVEKDTQQQAAMNDLRLFCEEGHRQWEELSSQLPTDSPARLKHGYFEIGFALVGADSSISSLDLRDKLRKARSNRTNNLPSFSEGSIDEHSIKSVGNGVVETWLGYPRDDPLFPNRPVYGDYWRANCEGQLYTIRGYNEDSAGVPPGTLLEFAYPIRHMWEAASFLLRFVDELDNVESVCTRVCFRGLKGRQLSGSFSQVFVPHTHVCETDIVSNEVTVSITQLRDSQPEVLHELLEELYASFNFFPLKLDTVVGQLETLRKGSG